MKVSSTNKKVFLIIFIILGALTIATVINVALNFKSFSKNIAIDKADSIAESVRDGLTSHMVNNTIDKRELFLENMSKHQDVKNLHLFRSQKVIEQFGDGLDKEHVYSQLEDNVLKSAKSGYIFNETKNSAYVTVAIPYIATKYSNPNCLTCHTNSKEGDVLGVISMDVDINFIRQSGLYIILKIIAISIVFLIIAMYIAKIVIKPYIKLFDDLEEGISRAYRGDFSHYIDTKLSDDAGKVASKLNELSEIFRFKKTIELDDSKDLIYKRLAYTLTDTFKIKNFLLMEIDSKNKRRSIVLNTIDKNKLPSTTFDNNANDCRAFRTSNDVLSTEFFKVCATCHQDGCEYLCIPFNINDSYSLILHLRSSSADEVEKIKELEPIIKNYFELAEPVLESRYLLNILEQSSLKDSLTELYNRRYLDTILNDKSKRYVILMIDIDYFKKVNDNYGHDIGDKVLVGLSDFLRKTIKGSDVAIRYGGEEFLIVLYDISIKDATKIAQNIRESFSKIKFDTGEEKINETLSIGLASYPDDSDDPIKVIKYADNALYKAKNSGRDRVVLHENMTK